MQEEGVGAVKCHDMSSTGWAWERPCSGSGRVRPLLSLEGRGGRVELLLLWEEGEGLGNIVELSLQGDGLVLGRASCRGSSHRQWLLRRTRRPSTTGDRPSSLPTKGCGVGGAPKAGTLDVAEPVNEAPSDSGRNARLVLQEEECSGRGRPVLLL